MIHVAAFLMLTGSMYTFTYCPDGTYTYSVDGDVIFTDSWDDDGTTWEEIQEAYCN